LLCIYSHPQSVFQLQGIRRRNRHRQVTTRQLPQLVLYRVNVMFQATLLLFKADPVAVVSFALRRHLISVICNPSCQLLNRVFRTGLVILQFWRLASLVGYFKNMSRVYQLNKYRVIMGTKAPKII